MKVTREIEIIVSEEEMLKILYEHFKKIEDLPESDDLNLYNNENSNTYRFTITTEKGSIDE